MKTLIYDCNADTSNYIDTNINITPLTQYQLDCEDWIHMDYAMRIHAPKILARMYPHIYAWFQVNNFPIESRGDMRLLYCNDILDEDLEIIRNNNLLIENRP